MSIRVELELADGSFTTRMIHAGETVAQFQNNVGQAITSVKKLDETTTTFLGTLRDLTVTFGMARAAMENIRAVTTGWAGDIIKVNAEMEKLGFLLRGMSSASDPLKEARDQVKFLREEASKAPFSLHALTDTFVKMKSTGIDPMKGAFKGMIDAVAAFGGTDDVMKRATIAITQMSGKGVIQMEELRQQLGEAVPRAVELMARSMGLSTGQLIQTISKGTLDAKTSLAALAVEFDLTFGGAAQAQMKTFNGMMSQMHTQFQSLALASGDAGFFDAVKKQLGDLNSFLSSDMARVFAQQLGLGLTSVVDALRSAVEWLVSFKSEIVTIGQIIGSAFLFRTMVAGVTSVIGVFVAMSLEVTNLTVKMSALRLQWDVNIVSRWVSTMQGASAATSMATLVARQGAVAFGMLGAAMSFVASVALPVAAIVVGLGLAFGLFSDKVKDAYDDMIKFGIQSREQFEQAEKMRDREIASLKNLKEMRDKLGGDHQIDGSAAGLGVTSLDDLIAKGQKSLSNTDADLDVGRAQLVKVESEKVLRIYSDELGEKQMKRRADRDIEEKELGEAFKRQLVETQKAHGDNKADTLAYATAKRERDLKLYEAEYEDYAYSLVKLNALREAGDKDATLVYEKETARLHGLQVKNLEASNAIRAMPIGPQSAPKLDDIDKLYEKAKGKLDDMKASNAGLRAELAGASGEYAKLAYMIEEASAKGKYMGPLSNEQIKEVTASLREQQKVHDELTQQVNAQNKLAAEAERILLKAKTDQLDILTEGMTETDKFWLKQRNGFFSGQTSIKNLQDKWKDFGKEVVTTGDAMKKSLDGLTTPVAALGLVLQGTNQGLQQVPGQSNRYAAPGAFSFSGSGSQTDRTIRRESGGRLDATNPNSTATGPAQFIESTWLQFLKEMHPDMLGAGREAALALRTNLALSRDATEWLAGQSRAMFARNGIESTNANVDLGHFLGPTGATAALTKPDDTMVRMIPELTRAIEKNYEVFKNISTVGDLKAWSIRHSGSGTDAPGPRSNVSSDVAGNIAEAEQIQLANKALQGAKNLQEEVKRLNNAGQELIDADAGKLSHLAEAVRKIKDGKGAFGKDNRNAEDPVFAVELKAAADLDAKETTYAEKAKVRKEVIAADARRLADQESLQAKEDDLNQRLIDERKFKFSAAYYSQLRQLQIDKVREEKAVSLGERDPAVSAEYMAAREKQLNRARDAEIEATLVTEQQKTLAVEKSLLTVDGEREAALQQEVRRQQQLRALYSKDGQSREQIEAATTRSILAYRKQQFQLTPLGGMIKQMSDWSNNMQTAAVGWVNGFNDRLVTMVMTGKADWKGLVDQIIKDFALLALKAAEAKIFMSIFGGGFGGGDIALGGASGPGQFATRHTGGMVDGSGFTKSMDFSAFIGAPRFHTGGFPGLTANEVPIIALKGEQVGWPEDLAKQYGGGGVAQTNHFDIKVQGSSGTQAQNADLADKIGVQMREHAKALVADQIRTQMKPGGLLRGGK